MKTTRVFLVRHGSTIASGEDLFAGSTDVDLFDEGRRQAERLAERLAGEDLVAVYASPMHRTLETATILGQPHELAPTSRGGAPRDRSRTLGGASEDGDAGSAGPGAERLVGLSASRNDALRRASSTD